MICKGCADAQHDQCYDKKHNTDYRSCTCLHRPALKKEDLDAARSGESFEG